MKYRIQLDTNKNLFIAIDTANQNHRATGITIEQAVEQLNA